MTYTLQTQITKKKTLRHKGTSRAPSLYTYRDKNKDRNHIINSREMLQTSDKSARSPTILINTTPQTIKRICYNQMLPQSVCTKCRLHTGGAGLSFLDSLIFLHSWWESNENFLGVASVVSRPGTCQVSIAGEHLFCVSMEVVLCWKLLFSTCAWQSIRFSTWAPLHALFIPVPIGLCSYKNVLVIVGHSR